MEVPVVPEAPGPIPGLVGPRSPRIIELLGLPGAGKSTLATALLSGGARGGQRLVGPDDLLGVSRLRLPDTVDGTLRRGVQRLPARITPVARQLLWRSDEADPLEVLARTHGAFLEVVAHAPPEADAAAEAVLRWRSWPLSTMATHVALRRVDAPGRTVLVEEGLVQRANTVCIGRPELAARYFATQPLPDALVVLDVDLDVAQARIASRSKGPLLRHAGLAPPDVLKDLRRSAELIATAKEVLRGRGLVVLELDADVPTLDQRKQVLHMVESLPHRHRS